MILMATIRRLTHASFSKSLPFENRCYGNTSWSLKSKTKITATKITATKTVNFRLAGLRLRSTWKKVLFSHNPNFCLTGNAFSVFDLLKRFYWIGDFSIQTSALKELTYYTTKGWQFRPEAKDFGVSLPTRS